MAETLAFLMNTHDPSLPDDDKRFTVNPQKPLADAKREWARFLSDKVIGEPQEVVSRFGRRPVLATVEVLKQHGMVGVYERVIDPLGITFP